MTIYTPSTLHFELQKTSSTASYIHPSEGICTQCQLKKTKKGGKIKRSRSGKRLFVCADCAH